MYILTYHQSPYDTIPVFMNMIHVRDTLMAGRTRVNLIQYKIRHDATRPKPSQVDGSQANK